MMRELLRTFILIGLMMTSATYASSPIHLDKPLDMGQQVKGKDVATLRALAATPPEDLAPELAVIVGNFYMQGMDDIGVNKDLKRARPYFKYAGENKVVMGDFLLGNLCFEEGDQACFVTQMEKVIAADDPKLSTPTAFQLTIYWNALDRIDKSFEVMRYTADVYQDSRAQFMVGYSVVSGAYVPDDLTQNDGQFYLYQACHNDNIHKEVQQKCELYGNKK